MANDKDFILKNAIEVGGSTSMTIGDAPTVGSVTVGHDLSVAAYDSKSFSFASQDTAPKNVAFKSDGTKMYLQGQSTDDVFQYSLSTAWDISTASYDSVNLDLSSQSAGMSGLTFKPDGTKLYTCDNVNDSVYQYSLTTAWDLSTASYDSVSFSVASQASIPSGVRFNSDGTSMFICDNGTDSIYQYTLSTAYDISSASYASKNFSFASQDTTPQGIDFNQSGTRLIMFGNTNKYVFQYSLSTPFDVSTLSYDSVYYDLTAQLTTTAYGLSFSYSGDKMYITSNVSDTTFQYTTGSTVATNTFDVSTGNYFATTPSVSAQYDFSNAGDTQTWQLEVTGNQVVVGYDLAIAAYDSVSKDFGPLISPAFMGVEGMFFKPDGTKVYVTNLDLQGVNEFDLSTAWDLTTMSYSSVTLVVSSRETSPRGLFFKPDGTKLYHAGATGDKVYEYDLSTAWDLSTAVFNDFISISSKHANPRGVAFNTTGTKMFTVGTSTAIVYEWALGTAWDVTTAVYSQNFSHGISSTVDITFNNDGTKCFLVNTSADTVREYSLTTAFDVSTMSYDGNLLGTGSQDTTPNAIQFKSDGTKLFVGGGANATVYQYTTATSTGITITWDADIQWAGGTAPDSPANGEKDLYTITTDDGGTTYVGIQSGDNFS